MKSKKLFTTLTFVGVLLSSLLIVNYFDSDPSDQDERMTKTSGAGYAMDQWVFERAYPNEAIPTSSYIRAFADFKAQQQALRVSDGEWESLGPENIGGRTLCLAFHPTDPDVIYAGSASGGLWKTSTRGVGRYAWSPVPTGHPVLAVSSIVLDPDNPDIMYIGTGETYGGGVSQPGVVNRYTRGTYGIGILKTVDGGLTWDHILVFDQDEIKGIQDIEMCPLNNNELYAAATDGLYYSSDAGETWEIIFNEGNCIDVELDPTDNDVIYVSYGNLNETNDPDLCGIFKSVDHGASFFELTDAGLLNSWSGSAKLTIDPSDPSTIYANIQVAWFNTDPTTPAGIFRSTDAGATWENINNQNIALYQGWYSHDLAVNPNSPEEMICVGIDSWRSIDGGSSFLKETLWNQWEFGIIDVNEPEGGPNYVHADMHAVYFHPMVDDEVYIATDGGVFGSYNGGITYTTLNGGLQTTQFYANMGNSATDPGKAICGAQDNATYIYEGDPSWRRVIGGDGMCAAIDNTDDQIIYGSYQRLNILKSTNGGLNFYFASPALENEELTAFAAPFQLAPSDNDVIYAGAQRLYRSESEASFWEETTAEHVDGENVIVNIAVSYDDPEVLMLATSPDPFTGIEEPKVFLSTDGGESFDQMMGLPDRVCKDIAFDPVNSDIIYVVFSGFGTGHVYKTENGGDDWFQSDLGLPDIPTNTIVVDPDLPDHVYVGNDLTVYFSSDAGETWSPWSEGLPEATIMMHLDISPSNNKLRIATHGRGLFERDLEDEAIGLVENPISIKELSLFPNPAVERLTLTITSIRPSDEVQIQLYDALGKSVKEVYRGPLIQGKNLVEVNGLQEFPSGTYHIRLVQDGLPISKSFILE